MNDILPDGDCAEWDSSVYIFLKVPYFQSFLTLLDVLTNFWFPLLPLTPQLLL